MPERVSGHEKRYHQEHYAAILQLYCAPVKGEPKNNVGKANVANKVAVRFTRCRHVRRNIEKPLYRPSNHPDSVSHHGKRNDMDKCPDDLLPGFQVFLRAGIRYCLSTHII